MALWFLQSLDGRKQQNTSAPSYIYIMTSYLLIWTQLGFHLHAMLQTIPQNHPYLLLSSFHPICGSHKRHKENTWELVTQCNLLTYRPRHCKTSINTPSTKPHNATTHIFNALLFILNLPQKIPNPYRDSGELSWKVLHMHFSFQASFVCMHFKMQYKGGGCYWPLNCHAMLTFLLLRINTRVLNGIKRYDEWIKIICNTWYATHVPEYTNIECSWGQ